MERKGETRARRAGDGRLTRRTLQLQRNIF
jgi:hypothetical protein